MTCEVKDAAHVLGKKWCIHIIEDMAIGNLSNFNEFLKNTNGLTAHTLSLQLKELEDEGIIRKKTAVENNVVSTEYSLTKKGAELHDVIKEIKKWNIKWNKTPKFCMDVSCSECARNKAGSLKN